MELQQFQAPINRVDKADLPSQNMKGADAAMGNAPRSAGNLIMNVVSRVDGSFAAALIPFVETAIDPTLAVVQLLGYSCATRNPSSFSV